MKKKYMENGPYEVSTHEDTVLQQFGKFIVYYPTELETSNEKYPVIVMCNGSGTPLSKYPAVSKHMASWGFIVVGTEENYSWNGFGAEMCLRYLERWNDNEKIEDKTSIFYQKVDFNHVGIVGHSQGGIGVINAITDTAHSEMLYAANGYVTAWFMWHLQGDEEAAGAFIGENAEIMNNSLYQDQKHD